MERQREEKVKAEARLAVRKSNKEAKELELAAGGGGESSEVKVSTRRGDAAAAATAGEGSSSTGSKATKKTVPLSTRNQPKRKADHVEEVEVSFSTVPFFLSPSLLFPSLSESRRLALTDLFGVLRLYPGGGDLKEDERSRCYDRDDDQTDH